jgi:hypothetical protein
MHRQEGRWNVCTAPTPLGVCCRYGRVMLKANSSIQARSGSPSPPTWLGRQLCSQPCNEGGLVLGAGSSTICRQLRHLAPCQECPVVGVLLRLGQRPCRHLALQASKRMQGGVLRVERTDDGRSQRRRL